MILARSNIASFSLFFWKSFAYYSESAFRFNCLSFNSWLYIVWSWTRCRIL